MNQKVVVVTGCTEGGIGYHLAKEFAQNNCRVFATARRVEAIGDVEALGMEKVHLDVANKESIQTAIEQIVEKAGRIDILVNNAAIHSVGAIADVDLGQVRRAIETNVIGVLAMSQAVIPLMAAQGGGKIVNIGSIVGYLPLPWAGIYSMTKAALSSFSDTMRIEVKPFNIDVIVVTPGAIKSHIDVSGAKETSLPLNSLYTSIADRIRARGSISQGPKATPTDVFARHTVAVVLRSSPPRYFTYGHLAIQLLWLSRLPRWITDYLLGLHFGVNDVKKIKQE